uniref:protein unc-13 homolog D-like isoform X1 n=2 Tax=Myxine glutinosa TaxID=7769 RepID=UPI0035902848
MSAVVSPPLPICEEFDRAFQMNATKTEDKDLYEELLYWLTYKVGRQDIQQHDRSKTHLKELFCISNAVLDEVQKKVKQNKPPNVLLKVTVQEARRLVGKNLDDKSNVYCSLGVVHQKLGLQADEDLQSENFLDCTSVIEGTVNPVWNETFEMEINEVECDVLYVYIWNRCSDPVTLRQLSRVRSWRSARSFYKKVKIRQKSHPIESPKQEDDFLGRVVVWLKELKSPSHEAWYNLKPRSLHSNVFGDCKLLTSFIARVRDTTLTRQGRSSLGIYISLLDRMMWKDSASKAEDLKEHNTAILSDYAVHLDLTPFQICLARWLLSSKFHADRPIPISYLHSLLVSLNSNFPKEQLSDQEPRLRESLESTKKQFLNKLKDIEANFPASERESPKLLCDTIKCLQQIFMKLHHMPGCKPQMDLKTSMSLALKEGAQVWYNEKSNKLSSEKGKLERLSHLVQLCEQVLQRLHCRHLHEILSSEGKVDVSVIRLTALGEMLAADITFVLEECAQEKTKGFDQGQMAKMFSQLFVQTQYLDKLGQKLLQGSVHLEEHEGCLHPTGTALASPDVMCASKSPFEDFRLWFEPIHEEWLQEIHAEGMIFIKRAVEKDKLVPELDKDLHSTSVFDMCQWFSQQEELWLQEEYSEAQKHLKLLELLCDVFCRLAQAFAEKMCQIIPLDKCPASTESCRKVCCGLANMHEMNAFMMGLPHRWNWNKWQEKAVKCGPSDADNVTKLLKDCKCHIWNEISKLITQIAIQITSDLNINPDPTNTSSPGEDVPNALAMTMEKHLSLFHQWLPEEIFKKFLPVMWLNLLEEIDVLAEKGQQKPRDYHTKLHLGLKDLEEVFCFEGNNLSEDVMHLNKYKMVARKTRLLRCSTRNLMQTYLEEKADMVDKNADLGILTVKVSFSASVETLSLELLNLSKLSVTPAQDDARYLYIQLQLWPLFLFSESRRHQSKPINLDSSVVIDEKLELPATAEACRKHGASVVLRVKLRDGVKANMLGQAILPLCTTQGLTLPNQQPRYKDPKSFSDQIKLHLQPLDNDNDILKVLQTRTGDAEAKDFYQFMMRADTIPKRSMRGLAVMSSGRRNPKRFSRKKPNHNC